MIPRPPPFAEPVYVARPLLPSLEQYSQRLAAVWESGWLTNGGAQHRALEQELSAYLGCPHLSLFNNGTIALIVACQALRLRGEVITTPFTFPATPHVLQWNGITPVFADVDPDTMTIDPAAIEPLVNGQTSAILGVHVYGTPCEVDAIDAIAQKSALKVVYDGAHAFGATISGKPIGAFGDATMFSFHATKLFHTAEGGALAVRDAQLKERVDLLKNFGILDENRVALPGINGKMSELSAAMGIEVLRIVERERSERARVAAIYAKRLGAHEGIVAMRPPEKVRDSLQYFVVRVDARSLGSTRDALHDRLRDFNIVTRKYFQPLCSEYDCYKHLPSAQPSRLPVATRIAREVLCLPFYGSLGDDDVHRICDAIDFCVSRPARAGPGAPK
ncbi:MAG: DegT/DnrJ/EryC1/StrS family aminotransferase [Burkholderiaceae bacterium]|nr:DegT/DnrJ/EryC1/StrS family aminotransferase [Burkholderiaceae bacterium]